MIPDRTHPPDQRTRRTRASLDAVKAASLALAMVAGCTAELFYTPPELRGLWELEGEDRILNITERSVTAYADTGAACRLAARQDFAGPDLYDWEVFPAPDGHSFRFRHPGSDRVIQAKRLAAIPERCVTGSASSPSTLR